MPEHEQRDRRFLELDRMISEQGKKRKPYRKRRLGWSHVASRAAEMRERNLANKKPVNPTKR